MTVSSFNATAGHHVGRILATRRRPRIWIAVSAFGRLHLVLKCWQWRGNGRFQCNRGKLRFAPCVRRRGRTSLHQIGDRRHHQARDEDQQWTAQPFERRTVGVSELGTHQRWGHLILWFERAPDSGAPSHVLRSLVRVRQAQGGDMEPIEVRPLALEPAARFTTLNVETQRGDARWAQAGCRRRPDRPGAPKEFGTAR